MKTKSPFNTKFNKRINLYTSTEEFKDNVVLFKNNNSILIEFLKDVSEFNFIDFLKILDKKIFPLLNDISTDKKEIEYFLYWFYEFNKEKESFDKNVLEMILGTFFIQGRKSELYPIFFNDVCGYIGVNHKDYRNLLIQHLR